MTRKHYRDIAYALSICRPFTGPTFHADARLGMQMLAWEFSVDHIAQTLASENPRFDRERFIAECKGETQEVKKCP